MNNERAPYEVRLTDGPGAPSDEDLAELLSFMRGDCRFGWMGKFLTTHPQDTDDENQQRIHAAMLVLEERGDVIRHCVSAEGCVTWAPNVANNRSASTGIIWMDEDGTTASFDDGTYGTSDLTGALSATLADGEQT